MTEALLHPPAIDDVEAFLAWAEGRPERWQLIDGALVMMAGTSDRHVIITANATIALGNRLRGGPCRPFGNDRLVGIGRRNGFYPDLTVSCRDDGGGFSPDPILVIEVLSPSTEADDRGRKWLGYQQLPGLQHYLLLASDGIRAELWTRTGDAWRYQLFQGADALLPLPAIGVSLPLGELYLDIEAETAAAAQP